MKHLIALVIMLVGPTAFARDGHDGNQNQTKAPAKYWVPVGTQLAKYALFDLPEVKIESSAALVKLHYTLPEELTGNSYEIEFSGTPPATGPMTLTGVNGKMVCPSATDLSDCAVSYHDVIFDAETRSALIKSISASEDEVRKRELVAARFQFGGEPHGFLRILTVP